MQLIEDVEHSWQDKYHIAEFLCECSLRSVLNCLQMIGITKQTIVQMKEWSKERSVTVRFQGEETCDFIKEETREDVRVTDSTKTSGIFGDKEITNKVITKITEYFWKFHVSYSIIIFQGNDVENSIVINSSSRNYEIITTSKLTPKPKSSIIPNKDINLTWIFKQIQINNNDITDDGNNPKYTSRNIDILFEIDKEASSCHTPRRNNDIETAIEFFISLSKWNESLNSYFNNHLFPIQKRNELHMESLNSGGIFVPIIPIFEKKYENILSETSSENKLILPKSDIIEFMNEQELTIQAKENEIKQNFPKESGLICQLECIIVVFNYHCQSIVQYFIDGIQYIEEVLRRQILSVIGKELTPQDITEYMEYNNRRLFKDEYKPKLLSYCIRRPNHYPEGVLSVENNQGRPILSITRKIQQSQSMKFNINEATSIEFDGPKYIHGWINNKFSGESGTSLKISSRTHQFSSYIVIIGNIISSSAINPKYAMIVQNKDELMIPLILEDIPTAKAFKDAIESLSPEQQRFAKAFRSMQLESSLFGICIIQIKPQLEKVLNLPECSLTKEIQLGQDLMKLFIEHQIPSDLLSYDGDNNASVISKLDSVQQNVSGILGMIQSIKDKELEEKRRKEEYERQLRLQKEAEEAARLASIRGRGRGVGPSRGEIAARRATRVLYGSSSRGRGGGRPSPPGRGMPPLPRTSTVEGKKAPSSPSPPQIPTNTPSSGKSSVDTKINFGAKKKKNLFRKKSPSNIEIGAPQSYTQTTHVGFNQSTGEFEGLPPEWKRCMKSAGIKKQEAVTNPEAVLELISKLVENTNTDNSPPIPDVNDIADTVENIPESKTDEKENIKIQSNIDHSSKNNEMIDFTKIPSKLDSQFELLDTSDSLHTTILSVASNWQKKYQKTILGNTESKSLNEESLKEERDNAFDLLDCLTKSGELKLCQSEFHVVLVSSYCFDKSVLNSLCQDNLNPIEELERSTLIVASTLFEKPVEHLIEEERIEQIKQHSPQLF